MRRTAVAALALALLLAACSGSSSVTTTSTAPSTTQPATTTAPEPEPTTTVPETTTTTTIPLAEPEWDMWTLVLASIPIGEGAEADARAMAAAVPGSGILLSNDYPSLNPGYWVVFFGSWNDQPSVDECPDLNDAFSCYPRFLGDGQTVSAIAGVGEALVEIDTTNGEVIRTIDPYFSEPGLFRGGFALNPERTYLYYSEGWEDSWYSCEASPGEVGRISLETGVVEPLWIGTGVTVSTDGNFVAYLEASQCLPDPEAPDIWVMTPYDRVVVVDLIFNEPAFMDTAALPTSYDDPNALSWVRFHPDGEALVATTDGTVYKVPLGSGRAVQDHPVVLRDVQGFPVDVSGNAMITSLWTDTGNVLMSYDLSSGLSTELWTTELWVAAGVSPEGALIAAYENWIHPYLSNPISVDNWVTSIDW